MSSNNMSKYNIYNFLDEHIVEKGKNTLIHQWETY